MNYRTITGPDFGGNHPLVFLQICRNDHPLIGNISLCRHIEGDGRFHNEIRLTSDPSFHPLPRSRRILRIAFWRTGIHPSYESVDIRLGERAVIGELPEVRIGEPRRHLLRQYCLTDRFCPRARLFVRQQRHRGDLARTMTFLAVVLQNWLDVLMERN